MVVITIIAILALITIPSLISARQTANETVAIQTLRSINTAQQQFIKSAKADEDGDSLGEFGGLGELAGVVGVRGGAMKVPTDLTGSMSRISAAGEVSRSGYLFRVYLPDSNGRGVREDPGGGYPIGTIDPNNAEGYWCCYAWPTGHGISGRRSFFVNQGGEILFCDEKLFTGVNCADIRPGSAYITFDLDSITGRLAIGTVGPGGTLWRTLN
jgi:type II secretory pathway pseudopilin PulG